MQPLEAVYREHHAKRRGVFFVLYEETRGGFLQKNIGTGKRVLDIGCRDGALTRFYREGNEVLGLDIDTVALEHARDTLGISIRQVDLNGDWGVEPGYDVVVACEVIEHLYYPGVVIKKAFSVLRPGGVLLGTIPHAFSLQSRVRFLFGTKAGTPMQDPTHINHFSVAELRAYLADAGFVGISIESIVARRFRWLSWAAPHLFSHTLLFKGYRPGERSSAASR